MEEMTEWSMMTVGNCLEPITLRGIHKVLSRDYQSSGNYPIVDQGQTLVAGWTDDEMGVVSSDLPVVVFGDHTRALKYVDFPFVRGADGTQILKPKAGIDTLFFYYACRAIDLPSRGYNRHFRILKEREIPIPSLREQHGIAHVLRRIDNVLSLQDEQLRTLAELKRTAMRTLFTRGLRRGEAQKETEIGPVPESWNLLPLSALCVGTDSIDLRSEGDRMINYVDVSSISRDYLQIETTSIYKLREAPSRARKRILTGDVIFATVRPTLLRAAIVPDELDNQVCSTAFCVLRPNKKMIADRFIHYLVQRKQFVQQLAEIQTGASYPAVTDRMVKEQIVPAPSVDEQREIVSILDAIDRKIDLHRRKRAVLDDLFKALLNELMTGEIRVGDLDTSSHAARTNELQSRLQRETITVPSKI